MMKKILVLLAYSLISIHSAFAISPSYRGYVETGTGYAGITNDEHMGGGMLWNISTTHGFDILDGLFVGLGVDITIPTFKEYESGKHEDYMFTTQFYAALFAEGRYHILRDNKFQPFIGMRIGGGYNGNSQVGTFYLSPALGCSFNLTEKFGFDASLGYSLFTGDVYNEDLGRSNTNCITFRLGVHF